MDTFMFEKRNWGITEMNVDRSCAERMLMEDTNTGLQKCDSCNRELRSSTEWVCSDHQVICNSCYRNLLTPDKKIHFED